FRSEELKFTISSMCEPENFACSSSSYRQIGVSPFVSSTFCIMSSTERPPPPASIAIRTILNLRNNSLILRTQRGKFLLLRVQQYTFLNPFPGIIFSIEIAKLSVDLAGSTPITYSKLGSPSSSTQNPPSLTSGVASSITDRLKNPSESVGN